MEDGAERILYVIGEDLAGNKIAADNVVSFSIDAKAPAVEFTELEKLNTSPMTYQGYTGQNFVTTQIGAVDLYKTNNASQDATTFQFHLADHNLAKVEGTETYEDAVKSMIHIYAKKAELSAMGDDGNLYCRYQITEFDKQGNDLEQTPFSIQVVEPVVDAARKMITSCDVKLSVKEGYYENFYFSIHDVMNKSGDWNEYYQQSYWEYKDRAFCVDANLEVNEQNVLVTCESANKKKKNEGQRFRINVDIPNVNIQYGELQVFKGKL